MKDERVTVAIASYNRSIELTQLLTSLLYQSFKNWDLVIVDESEIPSTNYPYFNNIINHIKKKKHEVWYERNLIRKGVGHIRNLTVKSSDNDLIIRIDDDSILHPDYIKILYNIMKKDDMVGAAGGVVPLFAGPPVIKSLNNLEIFNETKVNANGDIIFLGDDGGIQYSNAREIISHHLRSSFMFRKSIHDIVGGHPSWVNDTGYREETIFTQKLAWERLKLITDPRAICWHNPTASGGTRSPDYAEKANRMDEAYREWFKKMIKKKGGHPFTQV